MQDLEGRVNETGFYMLGTAEYDATRVLAVARCVPDAMAYVYKNAALEAACDAYDISSVEIPCGSPDCSGPSREAVCEWIVDREPERLVMDTWAYGTLDAELFEVIATRRRPTFLLQRETGIPNDFVSGQFAGVFRADDTGRGVFVSATADELPSRAEARAQLGGNDRPLVALVGESAEVNSYVIEQCQETGCDSVVLTKWPMTEMLIGADLVVGPASHISLEARAMGVAMASYRSTRDQLHLADTNAADIAKRVANLDVREPWPISYPDTASEVAASIGGDR
jgi:hypothetical protein